MIFLRFPFQCDLKVLECNLSLMSAHLVKEKVQSHLRNEDFVLFFNGKQVYDKDVIPDESTVHVAFSLPGGKGGFGSMLRAIGAQIEKTTNREACRDLSGRRLRDINEEQRLKKWIAKEAEREAEKIKRRQARLERLKSKAPHNFFDYEYEKEISELPSRVNEALNEGLQKSKQPTKRPIEEPKLPKKSWLGEDFPLSSSDSDSDEASNESAAKKLKTDLKDSSPYESDMSESSQSQSNPCSSKYSSFTVEDSNSSSYSSENTSTKVRSAENNSSETVLLQEKDATNELNSNKHGESISVSSTPDTESSSEESVMKISKHVTSEGDKNSEVEMEICQAEEKPTPRSIDGSKIEEKLSEGDTESASSSKSSQSANEPETKKDDNTPVDPMEFQSVSELEELGLDRLKSALIAHGLKCGGTLSDRAQRLWRIRGLQPHEYPANLLAKKKK